LLQLPVDSSSSYIHLSFILSLGRLIPQTRDFSIIGISVYQIILISLYFYPCFIFLHVLFVIVFSTFAGEKPEISSASLSTKKKQNNRLDVILSLQDEIKTRDESMTF
jgi:hypothetical protein